MIINKKQLIKLRYDNQKLKIGLCHGVFDILHEGHINHFIEAKKKSDILVVSVTSSKFVNKGPRQPLNNDTKRLKLLENIKHVDYVFLNNEIDSANVISSLKPNFYFKGKDYSIKDNHGNLLKEKNAIKKAKGKIIFTKSELMSSTKIFNNSYHWTNDQKKFLKNLRKETLLNFVKAIKEIENKIIYIIGEPILDRYKVCKIIGTTTKDPAISVLEENNIDIAGGVLAVAKMAAEFAKEVNLLTFGNPTSLKKYLKNFKNIKLINLSVRQRIQCKTRYINSNRGEKLIQITNFEKNVFTIKEKTLIKKKLKKYLNKELIICDFGVGLFESDILNLINKNKSQKYINVQTNSINLGFNLFTKYNNFSYLSLDEREWKLGLKLQNINKQTISNKIKNTSYFSITMGKLGSIFVNKKKSFNAPVFVNSVKDTTGSGDAYFILTTLFLMTSINKDYIIPFIGNLYAGMHGQNLGNSKIVNKKLFIQNVRSILNI